MASIPPPDEAFKPKPLRGAAWLPEPVPPWRSWASWTTVNPTTRSSYGNCGGVSHGTGRDHPLGPLSRARVACCQRPRERPVREAASLPGRAGSSGGAGGEGVDHLAVLVEDLDRAVAFSGDGQAQARATLFIGHLQRRRAVGSHQGGEARRARVDQQPVVQPWLAHQFVALADRDARRAVRLGAPADRVVVF